MRRLTLVLVILIVLAIAAGVFSYVRGKRTAESNANTNAPVVGNANATIVETPVVTKGDITVNASITYRDLQMTIETALKTTEFHRKKAPDRSTYVVLFLEPFSTKPLVDPLQWSSREIRLQYGSGTVLSPTEVSVPSREAVSGGYLWFTAPSDAKNFTLLFGAGESAENLALGF